MTTPVSDVMTRNVVSLRTHAEFKEIVQVMRARRFSAYPVIDDSDHVIGVVSEDDLLVKEAYSGSDAPPWFLIRHADKAKVSALTAADLMTSPAITIPPGAPVSDAARKMHAKHIKRLPVVTDDGRLAGIVSRIDLLGVYARPDDDIRDEIVEQVIGSEFRLNPADYSVTVSSSVVTIRGTVHDEQVALSLLTAIRGVTGVVAVRDRLQYQPS